MGRKSGIPAGDAFLPGTSAEELKRMSKAPDNLKDVKRYLAAYHRKRGKSVKDAAESVAEDYETVRVWLARFNKEGVSGIPRRWGGGRGRKLTRRQVVAIAKLVQAGPKKAGLKSGVWSYRSLHAHVLKKFKTDVAYSTFVANLHEIGIVLKTPRPEHPKAASDEERAEFRRETRGEILKYAQRGFVPVFEDEAHLQSYKNAHRTLAFRGVEAAADSSVERARLTLFGAAGDGFYYLKRAKSGNSSEFIAMLERMFELFGKIQLVADYANYHVSKKTKKFVEDNSHRLKLHYTLKYTPNDNPAETMWVRVKGALANKQLRSRDHMNATIAKAVESGEVAPVAIHSYGRVSTRRVGAREARSIRAKIREGEHFFHAKTPAPGRVRLRTPKEIKRDKKAILPPERRDELPYHLAHSDLPEKFLANLPDILQAQ